MEYKVSDFIVDGFPNRSYNICTVCDKKIKTVKYAIGIIEGTNIVTTDVNRATQGFYPIGIDCLKRLLNGETVYELE